MLGCGKALLRSLNLLIDVRVCGQCAKVVYGNTPQISHRNGRCTLPENSVVSFYLSY